ncbi:MAG: phosphoribosyltransferase family protein [Candidatus Zixiibacteriota bacterium]
MNKVLFENRVDAGKKLAQALEGMEQELKRPIVLGIPRGGVPVGYVLAKTLGCELDTIVLRKIPIPSDPEAGYGAVTVDRTVILNQEMLPYLHLSKEEMEQGIEEIYQEVKRRNQIYRKGMPFPELKGRSVILTDDGSATGYTMLTAVKFCQKEKPKEIIVAVPIASDSAAELIRPQADQFIVLSISGSFYFAVASFYRRFEDMFDEEVVEILEMSRKKN